MSTWSLYTGDWRKAFCVLIEEKWKFVFNFLNKIVQIQSIIDKEDRPDKEDRADEEDRADDVQAEGDEGELVGKYCKDTDSVLQS